MNKEDRRSKRTERVLLWALTELLKQKPLRNITVNELVQLADLHRSTFYTHYSDIYDFYHQVEQRFLAVYKNNVRECASHNYDGVFRSIITYMDENRMEAGMLLGENADPSFRNELTEFLAEQYIHISLYEDGICTIPRQFYSLASYHVGGIMNLLINWVQSGYATPKEELIKLCIELDYNMAVFRRKDPDKSRR